MKKDFKPLSCRTCYTSCILLESFYTHVAFYRRFLSNVFFLHETVKADDSVKISHMRTEEKNFGLCTTIVITVSVSKTNIDVTQKSSPGKKSEDSQIVQRQ